jgi:mono/diheme cytochrome c family protein
MRVHIASLISVCAGVLSAATPFDQAVQPVIGKACVMCHNDRLASGNLNISRYLAPDSIARDREGWERILQKVRSGEMPPKGAPRPPQPQIEALVHYVEGEFEKADRNVKPDPGRVTAHRLNRNEYSNTIRDLLAVDFRAEKDFPTDDTGYGFDNIGDVLTISPILMEKYVQAAESIAARAMGADPLPKPIEIAYLGREKKIRRLDASTIEATHRVDFDAEYIVRFQLPGERPADAKPVTLCLWMDGKLLDSKSVETKPSKLVYFNPYSEEEMRLVLPAGDHVFRAGFINDDFVKTLSPGEVRSQKKNKYLDGMTFVGPFPAKVERASRKLILACDPKSGSACATKIISTLARRAYRRPVTQADIAPLMRFVALAQQQDQNVEQGIQLAIEAMLVSPHFLFRIEHDASAAAHPVSDVELASRLSYFLWSSMPDDELLKLAETRKMHESATLDAQVKRMLADQRSAAFASNFAGQWLEIRNLDSVKPDPQKFPEWGPDLREDMRTETRMFFDHVLRENRPLTDFLDARYTFLNEQLAKHYGIKGVTGPDFRKVELASDERGGILSQASVLTVSSYPTRTSVVLRGKYVLGNILGAPPPPPPPDVPPLDEAAVGTAASLRQQMERHRSDPACASCHTKMDALGFGLENYDATGKWRTKDGKFPVDSSGTLPNGKSFVTPAELRKLLEEDLPDFTRCLTEKMLTYALGRGLQTYDRRTVAAIDRKLEASGYHFQDMIYEIVRSAPFRERRGEVVPARVPARPKEVARR